MKEFISKICPNFNNLIESEIVGTDGEVVGWYSSAILKDSTPIGGGAAKTKNKARRIALAELCERSLFDKIFNSNLSQDFLIKQFPSTSGFAFGFENTPTMFRAIAEACERWTWSKWIDFGYSIPNTEVVRKDLSKLALHYASDFDEIKFFSRKFSITIQGIETHLKIGIVLGIKGDGIFPGSRVASEREDVWEHGLLEAHRHYRMYKDKHEHYFGNDIIYKRINYFGTNKESALSQIEQASKVNWGTPKLRLLKNYKIDDGDYFLWRALCYDFRPWSEGKENRFVY
jgi:hypothetical protein